MKKSLLFSSLLVAGLMLSAQYRVARDNSHQRLYIEKPIMNGQSAQTPVSPAHSNLNHKGSRGLSALLNSQPIGTAGNLLSIINEGCQSMDVNDSLNAVTFIHRNDPTGAPGTNIAQYRFDVSRDGGATWQSNIGPITNDPTIDNISKNGRFPQAVIYNPAGNTVTDSAVLVYSGTYHNVPPNASSGTWQGEMRGRGKLSGDTSTFNVTTNQINGGKVAVATSLCQSTPGTFWNINLDYTGTFATGDPAITEGIIVEKGVWDNNTKNVVWTDQTIATTFAEQDASGTLLSVATGFRIAFDPTGQIGWIACVGDLDPATDSVYTPIFWKSTDGGATWGQPIVVDLESIQGITDELNPLWLDGATASSMNPTTAFECDLEVDTFGNPHMLVNIGNGTDWSLEPAGYDMWDITFDANASAGCQWKGIHLMDIFTYSGDMTNGAQPQTQANRPLISRTNDGRKLFFFWNETDFNFVGSSDNITPNLFGRAIDVVSGRITDLMNFTEGDTLWGGETANTAGGVFYGSIFPMVSPTCLINGNTFNIPLVMTQIDYGHDPGPNHDLGSDANPAAFWYINNINYTTGDFSQNIDQTPPTVTLLGQDTVVILVNTTYTEDGATAFDCTSGNITPTVVGSPDTAVVGLYEVLYIATDAAGNADTVVRTVIVGDIPVADFAFSFPQSPYKVQFLDQSTNFPTTWFWNFGDATASTVQNPLKTYTSNGTYNVCLTASNSFGSDQQCKDVVASGVGIEDLTFSANISMFPNPTTGKAMLRFNNNINSDYTVTVYNILGETVFTTSKMKAGVAQVELNLSHVASGLYMVKIQSSNATAVKQLTVNHK